jgi:hypothetical protein
MDYGRNKDAREPKKRKENKTGKRAVIKRK